VDRSNLLHNQKVEQKTYRIGVDEVGRGPWAGPVVACACALLVGSPFLHHAEHLLKDSKKCSKKHREKMDHLLREAAQDEQVIFFL